ncbi:MAG: NAD(P)-dependent dehydrogenase (short-subunit alcohol dehydrogenase family) [Gammaproteobacteria bacterium]|jgi:NAD(P)-dependent dehydrogenase (short-subunit alcohol dehydrogenase family)
MANVLITGCSTGIGLACAIEFAKNGFTTIATMRNLSKAHALNAAAAQAGVQVEILELDVTVPESVNACVADVLSRMDIDVLVNNAGVAGATPLELVDEARHKAMFEANYFGVIRLTQALLPHMRERRQGTIINMSSVAGRIAIPNQVPYSASKWALEAASEALAHEMANFGVRVRIIEPGVILTNIFDNAAEHTVYDKASPYINIMRRNGKFYAAGFKSAVGPEEVARVVVESALSESDQLRYLVGDDAKGWVDGRARMTDAQWVAMGGDLSDSEYNEQFHERFGIELP